MVQPDPASLQTNPCTIYAYLWNMSSSKHKLVCPLHLQDEQGSAHGELNKSGVRLSFSEGFLVLLDSAAVGTGRGRCREQRRGTGSLVLPSC